jgi:hydroxyacylglutathione hydrolase
MILKRIYDDGLAQASYLVGCAATGDAVVIDPNRDVEQYIEMAQSESLRIVAVAETHIHADYVSGSKELAERTGSTLYLSKEGGDDWQYAFKSHPNVTLVGDGSSIKIGNVRLDVMHTPGHTPEHISYVLTDEPTSSEPQAIFTGDFVFVGDVGRPDLLENAAGVKGTMEPGARDLHKSLQKIKGFADDVMVWPAHGAGSACGKSLGGVPVSTIGYEKKQNWAFKIEDEDEFVKEVLKGQPEPPVYFKQMKKVNKEGIANRNGLHSLPRLAGDLLLEKLKHGAKIVDLREPEQIQLGYIPGAVNIPLNSAFTNWAGWVVDYDEDVYFIAEEQATVDEAVRRMSLIGLDRVVAWAGTDTLRAYERKHVSMPKVEQIDAKEMKERAAAGDLQVLDIRGRNEWNAGHMPGATNIPLGYLDDRFDELGKEKPVAVHCEGGARTPIGITILAKHGFRKLESLTNGFIEYRDLGLPVEKEESEKAEAK